MRPDTAGSPTPTIPISELASVPQRPENFCGMHFNPVHHAAGAEVIRAKNLG